MKSIDSDLKSFELICSIVCNLYLARLELRRPCEPRGAYRL